MKGLGRTTDDQELQLEGRLDQAKGDLTQARREAPECLRQPAPRRPGRQGALLGWNPGGPDQGGRRPRHHLRDG
jgi:hypothetical protein